MLDPNLTYYGVRETCIYLYTYVFIYGQLIYK